MYKMGRARSDVLLVKNVKESWKNLGSRTAIVAIFYKKVCHLACSILTMEGCLFGRERPGHVLTVSDQESDCGIVIESVCN